MDCLWALPSANEKIRVSAKEVSITAIIEMELFPFYATVSMFVMQYSVLRAVACHF